MGRFGFNVADLHDSSLLVSHLTNSRNLVHAIAYSCQELAIYEETALAVVAHYRDTPFVSVPLKRSKSACKHIKVNDGCIQERKKSV